MEMQIEPPTPPSQPGTAIFRHRLGYMATLLIGVAVILLVTILAWFLLWGGGLKEAAESREEPPAVAPP